MKKIVLLLALLITVAAVTFADEQKVEKLEKDLCLLYSQNCATRLENIQEKIKRLKGEIQKGERVYTPEELKKLQIKLKDAEETIDLLLRPQPSR